MLKPITLRRVISGVWNAGRWSVSGTVIEGCVCVCECVRVCVWKRGAFNEFKRGTGIRLYL